MTLLPEYEKKLLLRIAQGEEDAFTKLFETYHHSLGAFIYGITKSKEITEEIVQDVFFKIWMSREVLAEINSFKAYLLIIARNAAISSLRKIILQRKRQDGFEKQAKLNETISDETGYKEHYLSLIDQAINELSPQRKKVYLLSREKGLKYEEIAREMGISKLTVRAHIQQAVTSITGFVRGKVDNELLLTWLLSNFFKNIFFHYSLSFLRTSLIKEHCKSGMYNNKAI